MATTPKTGSKARYAGIGTEAVERATGRSWQGWIDLLDREGAKTMTHKEIAQVLLDEFRLPAWWAQMVTVGYEQANGAREPNQTARGFRAHASRTIAADVQETFAAWNDADTRASWLGDAPAEVRSATPGKSVRLSWAGGKSTIDVRFTAKASGKTQVAVDEEGLPDAAAVKRQKVFWGAAFDRLQALVEPK